MSTNANKIVLQLLARAARDSFQDRRSEFRFPFFHPVLILKDGKSYSAFSRDISSSAIGLIHNMELSPGEFEIAVPTELDRTAKLRVRIERCESCGEGWYTSGGEFVDIKAMSFNA